MWPGVQSAGRPVLGDPKPGLWTGREAGPASPLSSTPHPLQGSLSRLQEQRVKGEPSVEGRGQGTPLILNGRLEGQTGRTEVQPLFSQHE